MKCEEAAEFISRLCDGLLIPSEVAQHIGTCKACGVHLSAYLGIGAELRRIASLEQPILKPRSWDTHEKVRLRWWQKGSATMKIPRFVFALMLVALLALSFSTGLFLTRAKDAQRWFQYELAGRDGKNIVTGTVPTNPKGNPYYDLEAGMTYADGTVWFRVRFVEQVGEAEKIVARTLWVSRGDDHGHTLERLRSMPEREFRCSPGENLQIPVQGYGNLEIKGHFESTLPENVRMGLFPEDGILRVDPPVILVRGKEMLMKGDMGGGPVSMERSYFAYGSQSEGWYLFSAKPIPAAAEGTVTNNQIEFVLDGNQYFLFTSNPILFGSVKVWVKHYASIKDADPTSPGDGWQGNVPRLAYGQLENLTVGK